MNEQNDFRPRCFVCGTEVIFTGNNMASEVYSAYEGDDEAMLMTYLCPKCGCEHEVVMPNKEERENDYKDYYKK